MLRMLIVAGDATQEIEMVGRASAALDLVGRDGEVVRSPRHRGLVPVARLDVGLFTRPLPDRLVVVGRDQRCTPSALASMLRTLDLAPDVCAVTQGGGRGPGVDSLLEAGGAFRGGPMCQAGGFAGDGRRGLAERLAQLGFSSIVLPEDPERPIDVSPPARHAVPA